MKKILNYILIGTLISFAYNCEDDVTEGGYNYVTFERGPVGFKADKDATTTKDIKVYAGNKTGSDRTYTVLVNEASTLATSYSVPSTVTIPANSNVGNLAVAITDDDTLGFVNQTLMLDFMGEAGVNLSEGLIINVTELCPDTLIKLSVTLDTWPDETTWEIFDLSGTPTVIFSGGPFINPDDDFAVYDYEFCLQPGDYGVVVYDAYGDGGSSYVVTAGADTLASGAVTGSSQSSTFTIQ